MPRYHIWTMGCQMNKADSSHIADYLESLGCSPAPSADAADITVLNTCVVRQGAEDKAVNKIVSLRTLKRKRPDLAIVVTGCLVDSQNGELDKRFSHVDLFLPPQDWDALQQWTSSRGLLPGGSQSASVSAHPSVTAFVPIIKGCNNFCSYCVVPYRRGREKSRPLEEIVCEVRKLVQGGDREATLLGQNVDSYGHDLPSRPDLADLLAELDKVEGLLRIRFLTNHPKDMSPKLIKAIAGLEKVCEHISLPVQAGDDEILKAMGRGYTAEQYCSLVSQIRSAVPGVALSTDVIVGFPGETEEQFEHTIGLLRDIRFDTVHIAVYSSRPDTIASKRFEDNVPSGEKERRWHKAERLQEQIATEINTRLLGQRVEVLVEGKKGGKWQGRTRTDKLVFSPSKDDCLGQLVMVEVTKTSPWSLQGKMAGVAHPADRLTSSV